MSNKHEDYLGVKDYGLGGIPTMWGPSENGNGDGGTLSGKKNSKGNKNSPKTTGTCPARKAYRNDLLRQKGTGNGVPSLADPIDSFEREPY